MNAQDDKRLAYIDSLRAIAAILVLWVHVSELYRHIGPAAIATKWVNDLAVTISAGRMGVVAFFAISGFVVPFSIKLAHRHPVREFLLVRFFRLYPAYWLSIPLGAWALWLWNRPLTISEGLVNLTMLEYVFDVRPAIGLYWTLAVELVFYLCCAILVQMRAITNYRLIGMLVVAALAVQLLMFVLSRMKGLNAPYWLSMWLLNLSVMFWGTLYRANLRGETRSRIDACFVWGIAFFFVVLYPIAVWMIGYSRAYSLGYSLGVLLFIVGTRVIRIEWRPLAWLGVISYSIYLFHPVVFSPVLHWMRHLPPDSWWRSWHLGSYVIAVLLLTIAFAAIVYRFVEKPGIELGRRLARRWFTGERDARRGDGLVPAASAAE